MIFSTQSVSQNFRLYNQQTQQWLNHHTLQEFVQHWKVVFVNKNQLCKGHKIGLGFPLTDIYYFAAVIAASELGLQLVVLDVHAHRPGQSDHFPLDLFVSGLGLSQEKHNYYAALSKQTEYWHVWDTYQLQDHSSWQPSVNRFAKPADILLLANSSGTTDRPKTVRLSQQFLCAVANRNQRLWQFDGNVVHVRNLHHGSSLATYFMPALMSDQCNGHFVYNFAALNQIPDLAQFCSDYKINHIQLPTTQSIDAFLSAAVSHGIVFDNLNLYTLSYINSNWQESMIKCHIASIVSVFGCNETSGPLFTNTLTADSQQFDAKTFQCLDNFYQFDFNELDQLVVNHSDLAQPVVMQDAFQQQGTQFVHLGRNDITRINDVVVDVFWLLELCRTLGINGQLVVDKLCEKLYLALWNNLDTEQCAKHLNAVIQERYGNSVCVNQMQVLDAADFVQGIKLDHEALRQFFRNQYEQTSASC